MSDNLTFKTNQEAFWAGNFGNEYISRNNDAGLIAANLQAFSKVLPFTKNIKTVIEFGSNIGQNLDALRLLLPGAKLSAIEINSQAAEILRSKKFIEAHNQSILDFTPSIKYDFVFIKGVLIHINPDFLSKVYKNLYDSSAKYILISEYYNPTPVAIDYRGHDDKLFKRDRAGEMMDLYPDLKLVEYGFLYHRDNCFEHGDSTWFLLEKK